jgi:SAM-dependent methyltransferase
MSQRCSSVLEAVRRTILSSVVSLAGQAHAPGARRLLDVGCWDGFATSEYAAAFGARALGVEIFDAPASEARRRDVEVSQIDLEVGRFPWPDESIDLVIANQVLEHLKNVWQPMSEMARVLRPGGWLIVSVPNLASLHNRILLMLGLQPSSIRTQGPHVRGFTLGEIVRLVRLGSVFTVEQVRGVGFYPLGLSWAAAPARLWPAASHTAVVLARKGPGGALNPWSEYLKGLETSAPQTFLRG